MYRLFRWICTIPNAGMILSLIVLPNRSISGIGGICIITIVAIWSKPHKRIARTIATVMWVGLTLVIIFAMQSKEFGSGILLLFFATLNVIGIWIGSSFDLKRFFKSLKQDKPVPEGTAHLDEPISKLNQQVNAPEQVCESCGSRFTSQYKLCSICGVPVGKRSCKGCKSIISSSFGYCPDCGVEAR